MKMSKAEKMIICIAGVFCAVFLALGMIGIQVSYNENTVSAASWDGAVMSWMLQGDMGLKITIFALVGLIVLFISVFIVVFFALLRRQKELIENCNLYEREYSRLAKAVIENIRREIGY